ncbi:MAG: T9SS C-terminal target domain-containing protein [Bacteroidetes bacterium]|nr:MAG: T9SS C-terminal target domain-containing protein [Bacteroidota bacterium]
MKLVLKLVFLLLLNYGYGQVVLDADGPGNTYELITSVLAPGYNPIETPDCSHPEFGDHIDEIFDEELNAHVFRFHIHVTPDNDRCINFDRQRNEIKSYSQSPDNLLGIENETVQYKWKFKLASGFQSSPNFTHIHQLKSVGGSLESMPMYTLTTRKGNPDRLELRYAETSSQITLSQTDLAPLIGTWLEVTETITYSTDGTYEITIKRVSDEETLFSYSNNSIINWRPGAEFVRPKWGIYRSLLNDQDLRDEEVLFANFSVEEIDLSSAENPAINEISIATLADNRLYIKNIPGEITSIQIFSIDGRKMMEEKIGSTSEVNLDVSSFPKGIYMINFQGNHVNLAKIITVQ